MYRPLGLLLFVVLGGLAGEARAQAASEISLDPLVSFITCMREAKPGYCIRERALGYFESWLTGEEDEDGPTSDQDEEQETGTKLSPYWNRMVDQVADRIAGFYGEEEEDEGKQIERRSGQVNQTEERQSTTTDIDGDIGSELARGHKKKKRKAIKKAIIKLVLIALLIKSKLKMLLTAFQTFLQFKAVLLASIYVIIHVIKLWVEIKHKHHPQKVIYYENAHHQHHYDHHDDHHHDYDDHGSSGGWSLWGRSGLEATTLASLPSIYDPFLGRSAQNSPYSAHIPKISSPTKVNK